MRAKCHDCKVSIISFVEENCQQYECPKCKIEYSEDDFCPQCEDWADSGNCFACKMD